MLNKHCLIRLYKKKFPSFLMYFYLQQKVQNMGVMTKRSRSCVWLLLVVMIPESAVFAA